MASHYTEGDAYVLTKPVPKLSLTHTDLPGFCSLAQRMSRLRHIAEQPQRLGTGVGGRVAQPA